MGRRSSTQSGRRSGPNSIGFGPESANFGTTPAKFWGRVRPTLLQVRPALVRVRPTPAVNARPRRARPRARHIRAILQKGMCDSCQFGKSSSRFCHSRMSSSVHQSIAPRHVGDTELACEVHTQKLRTGDAEERDLVIFQPSPLCLGSDRRGKCHRPPLIYFSFVGEELRRSC